MASHVRHLGGRRGAHAAAALLLRRLLARLLLAPADRGALAAAPHPSIARFHQPLVWILRGAARVCARLRGIGGSGDGVGIRPVLLGIDDLGAVQLELVQIVRALRLEGAPHLHTREEGVFGAPLAALLLRADVPAARDVHLDQIVVCAAEEGEAVVVLPADLHAPARDLQPPRRLRPVAACLRLLRRRPEQWRRTERRPRGSARTALQLELVRVAAAHRCAQPHHAQPSDKWPPSQRVAC